LIFTATANAGTIFVDSQATFNDAQASAAAGDSIIWRPGHYRNIFMIIEKDRLYISAEELGETVFTGGSYAEIKSDSITFRGFQYLDGDIGTQTVIDIFGSHIDFNQVNIRAYTCYKYLRVRETSQYVDVNYCNFENRINQADQNILSILVDNDTPGYNKVRHCSFKNFPGGGNDEGVEPIRIGVSSQADFISRSLVEYCFFSNCDGDGEIISSKATQNVYRFNTFVDNTKAELVLRHGSEAVVYGNFFLDGKGGVRVREGQNHYIYNNYFSGLNDRAINLQNEASDPLDNINVAFNSIIDCDKIILGGFGGSNPPTNVTIANNYFTAPRGNIFEGKTNEETWIGNIAFGNLGITLPESGLTVVDPLVEENEFGYFQLSENSPAIDAALPGYADLPQFPGMDSIDTQLLFDLMQQPRPASVEDKDIGSGEFPHNVPVQPFATEENTGPSYNTSVFTTTRSPFVLVNDLINVSPNPASRFINLTVYGLHSDAVTVTLFSAAGRAVMTLADDVNVDGSLTIRRDVSRLPAGLYFVRAAGLDESAGVQLVQTVQVVLVR
jgi:hypothetical protein